MTDSGWPTPIPSSKRFPYRPASRWYDSASVSGSSAQTFTIAVATVIRSVEASRSSTNARSLIEARPVPSQAVP